MAHPIRILAPFLAALALAQPAAADTLEGRWLTFDSDTGARRAVVEIRRQGPAFKGTIVELYLQKGEDPNPKCKDCSGEAKDKLIRGLEILTLEYGSAATEFKGKILDPEEGKVYRCTAVIEPGGKRLVLRGYVLIPLFGRIETWQRAQ